jgi:glycosyltransferase involved in cell wall biosynthesis
MNKLLVASTYLPPICGGGELVAWEIATRLTNEFEVHALTTSNGPVERKNVTIHRLPRRRWLPITYSSIYSGDVRKILNEVTPAIIHSHNALPWGYVLRNTAPIKIVTCHGPEVRTKHQAERFLVSSTFKHANVTTSPSLWLAQYIENEYGKTPVVIPNGVDTHVFKRLSSVSQQKNVVLFVGRFIRNKGVLDLAEAAKKLPQYEFWFVGSAEHENIGRRGVSLPPLPNLKVFDFISDRQAMAACYNQATICVFPSETENFPLVGLEAMACGRTLVATMGPRNGYSEYVENDRDGLLIEPHDINGLVKSIGYLMENESVREEFERNAIKKAVQFDWENVVDKYRALLDGLLRR